VYRKLISKFIFLAFILDNSLASQLNVKEIPGEKSEYDSRVPCSTCLFSLFCYNDKPTLGQSFSES
jgi:hypothetical protein